MSVFTGGDGRVVVRPNGVSFSSSDGYHTYVLRPGVIVDGFGLKWKNTMCCVFFAGINLLSQRPPAMRRQSSTPVETGQ